MNLNIPEFETERESYEQPKKQNTKDLFKKVRDKNTRETFEESTTRNVAQHGARIAETFIGLPGNLKKAGQETFDFIDSLIEPLKPEGTPSLKDIRESGKKTFIQPEKNSVGDVLINPPTSERVREEVSKDVAQRFTGDENYLEPRGKTEKAAGEFTQDVTNFFTPGTGRMRLMTRIGAPILGHLVKHDLKYLGASEENAEKAKLGTMLAFSLATGSNPQGFSQERIGEAKNMIPQNTTVPVRPLADGLMNLYNRLNRGLQVPSKSRAMQGMRELADQVDNNRISLHSLMDARDNINEWISEAGGWDVPANTRSQTLRNLNELKGQIINVIDTNLTQRFPQAAELYRTGYEASAVTHQSNAISNFIEQKFGRQTKSIGAKLLFPALGTGATILPKTALGVAATYPIYKVGQVLYRISKSPTLAGYYQEVIRNSLTKNAPAMISSLSKLDKKLAEEEQKERSKKGPTLQEFKSKFKKKG